MSRIFAGITLILIVSSASARSAEGAKVNNAPGKADESVVFTQKCLEGHWTGTWKTPASGFTFNLDFKVDAAGKISGSYAKPGEKTKSNGLGGKLTLTDPAKGTVTGTITFGPSVVFAAQNNVTLSPNADAGAPCNLKGLFITKAFPGELGKDELIVSGGTAAEHK